MQKLASFTLLLVLLLSTSMISSCQPAQPAQPAEPLAQRLEKLAPHAAGIAEVEVTEIRQIDDRPSCGSLYHCIGFRIIRSTGASYLSTSILIEHGGLQPPESRGTPPVKLSPRFTPVKLGVFQKGKRYWVAFSSKKDLYHYSYNNERCLHGILRYWASSDKTVSKTFAEAIRTDSYAEQPQYDPKSKLTHIHRTFKEKNFVQISAYKKRKKVWTINLPGQRAKKDEYIEMYLWKAVWAETIEELKTANRFQLHPKKYRILYMLEPTTGKTLSIRIAQPHLNPIADDKHLMFIQHFNAKTNKLIYEMRITDQKTGGQAVGAKTDHWVRKTTRNYDPNTGQLKTEKTFRVTGKWELVPVEK